MVDSWLLIRVGLLQVLCEFFFVLFWLCSQVYIIPDLALGFVENAGNPGFGLE